MLRHPLFLSSALLAGCAQLSKRWLHWPLPAWLTSYLSDILFLPLTLSLALAAHQLLYGRQATLPGSWVLAAWAVVALWFEGLLPRWSATAVADPFDVLAYAAGALLFQRWLNKPA
ncbi:hypothetical protein [Hymenobacter negativus]|uniref:Magnesium citrate secondary transporter n=1 Tax=Hymenobacter negativus TaxID=2795026 RepID=A0ABS3QMC9_9BACT|nr:hypothetical protein [Hymenobacter negativus]MBO2012421.1 hypothetical protein [Hymenobacter negativus]